MTKELKLTEDELREYDDIYSELQCAIFNFEQAEKRKNNALKKLKPAIEKGYKPFEERRKEEHARNMKEKARRAKESKKVAT